MMIERQAGAEEVPPGYKRTDVGVIPEDWNLSRLSDCGEVIMGQSPPGASYNRAGAGSPLINGPTEFTDLHPIKIQWTTQPAKFCKSGDLLICVRGSSTGCTNYADGIYAIGRGVAAIRANRDNDTQYVSCQVISGVSDILKEATGSTFPSVDGTSLRNIIIPLPSLPEQRAIAAALSDVDGLIGALDALIEKKRAIKQAAMQQLLTGKKRLPGFEKIQGWKKTEVGFIPEDWTEVKFSQICKKVLNGGTPSTKIPEYWGGAIPWITGAEVVDQRIREVRKFITLEAVESSATHVIPKGNLLLVTRTGVGKVAIAPFDIAISQDLTGIIPTEGISVEYLFWVFNRSSRQLLNMNQGTSINGITKNDLMSLALPLPLIPEQRAIAAVLSDMDAEIAALERRREKTKQIKQGMMQQLLTGRIRLVEPPEAAT